MTSHRARLRAACLALLLTSAWQAPDPRLAAQRASLEPPVVAITGGTILTVTGGTIENGTILLRDGRIAAIGRSVPVPPGAELVDATGRFVTPGIVDCHSHIAADSLNEAAIAVSSMTGIEDVFNPTDVNLYRDLAGGVTTANVLHGSANPIGGKSFVIKLRWGGRRTEDFVFPGAMPSLKMALGENPKRPGGGAGARPNGGPERFPATRMGIEFVIRNALTRARAYENQLREFERRRAAGEDAIAPRRDLQLEPLVEVLQGRRLVHVHAYRADEMLMLLRLADEFGFKIATFQHALEGYKIAKELAAHGAGVSTFADWWGFKIEAVDAIPQNAALLTRKGVLASISSDSAELARRLNTEAAKSIKWGGLTDDEALALVTINPARQLRIDHRVGSLEVGKDADVVIWNRHPLSSYAIVDRVYIDGRRYYDRADDRVRLAHLADEKAELGSGDARDRRNQTVNVPPAPSNDEPVGRPALQAPTRPTTATAGVLAVVNAKIIPIATPAIDRGTIVIRDGVIDAVGANIAVPPGAQVIDADGAEVYPGFIDARSNLGLAEPGPVGFADSNDIQDFNPQLRPQVAFHNDSDAIPVARANGVTTIVLTPGGGLLGGQIAVMNLDGWTWEESTVASSIGVSFQFPPLSPRGDDPFGGGSSRTFEEIRRDRDGRLDRVARMLDDARTYAKAAGPARPTDWVLEALVPVVERRVPLVTHVSTVRDVSDVVAFADRTRVKIVISGGAEVAMAAPLLSARRIPVILDSVLSLPPREDLAHEASYAAAGELARAGVKIAFSAGDFLDVENVRQLPYNAAEAVAWGLPHDEALRALTLNAAEILGIADRIGSIEPGKIGNLVIARGDPLEVKTVFTHVIIAGRDVGLDNRQLALYERYSSRQ